MSYEGVAQLATLLEDIAEASTRLAWPNARYANDIEGFARDILGFDSTWDGQRRIYASVQQPRSSTVVRAGTKVGKTFSIGVIILWFYCTVGDANIVFTASTMPQAKATIWQEVIRLHALSGRCAACRAADAPSPCPHSAKIDGHPSPDPSEGLRSPDGRRLVRAVVSNKSDAYAGISGGSRLLLVADECTGISDTNMAYFRANRHGARAVYYANPTNTSCWFYDAHTERQSGQHTLLHLSTFEAAETGIDGLATKEVIAEAAREYGEDSPIFLSKFKGEFPLGESAKLISRQLIAEAASRWPGMPTPAEPLKVGLDPAGLGEDRTTIVARRGDKVIDIRDRGQLTEPEVVAFALETIRDLVLPGERAELRFDATGQIGSEVWQLLRAHTEELRIVPMIANAEPVHKDRFKSLRDQVWWVARMWLREGGAIPPHEHLHEELHAPEHGTDHANRTVIDPKRKIKSRIGGRSPDFADAFCLAVWNDPRIVERAAPVYSPTEPTRGPAVNPYEVARASASSTRSSVYGRRRR